MFKERTIVLQILLVLVSITSLVNIFIFKEHLILLPFTSFSVIQWAIHWYVNESIVDLIICILICLLFLAAAISIRKRKIVIPALTLVYLFVDIFNSLSIFGTYPYAWLPLLFYLILTTWMGYYCIAYKKNKLNTEA